MKKLALLRGIFCASMFFSSWCRAQELGPPPLADDAALVSESTPVAQAQLMPINLNDRAAVVQLYQTTYLASQGIASGWTGNRSTCTAGTTSQAYAEATISRVNCYRVMAGLPGDVVLTNTWNSKAQDAALMMSAQGSLSHSPGTNWSCYTANGAEAAGKSNLALGADAAGAIDLYMDDPGSGGNAAVGHRRWVLYPPTKTMGTGNIPSTGGWAANDLWVIGGSGSRPAQPAWVAWPPPNYVPYQIMPRSSGRWSFSYPGATFTGATVFMQRAGTNVALTLEAQAQGYGDNTIVWVPQGVPAGAPASDITYSVTLSNVVVSSQSRTFTYKVTIIDPNVPVLSVGLASGTNLTMSWPSSSSGYSLQQNTSPNTKTGWTNANVTPQLVGNQYVVKVPIGTGPRFYRLSKP
jgi:hypothetical protein